MFSRVGVYMRLPGVDVDRFSEAMQGAGLLGYIDALSGGSISKVGVFSLGESLVGSCFGVLVFHPACFWCWAGLTASPCCGVLSRALFAGFGS